MNIEVKASHFLLLLTAESCRKGRVCYSLSSSLIKGVTDGFGAILLAWEMRLKVKARLL